MSSLVKEEQGMQEPFLFVGERLWLDFVNTQFADKGQSVDLLGDFEALLRWLAAAQAADAKARENAAAWSRRDQEEMVEYAVRLRSVLRQAAEGLAQGKEIGDAALGMLNEVLGSQRNFTHLARTAAGYETTVRSEWVSRLALLAPLAASVADTLTGDDLTRLRNCEDPACLLYFYDTSKNKTRRWCSMELCGNRHKAAAHYRRSRQTAGE